MTAKERSDNEYYLSAKTRTFYKGEQFYEIINWIISEIDTVPETDQGCSITKKYCISVKTLNEDRRNYKAKGRIK